MERMPFGEAMNIDALTFEISIYAEKILKDTSKE